ncbi:hypothetical protein FACS18942_00440 [Planctomycetales bacterium]|nr:hypothetical protein FACS18942_00440 [Planctomycetales bacterium]GHT36047.1 hypothetical protein FACS189427_06880 [Planctomycetales bacterium]
MRFTDFLYFLEQIFFPKAKADGNAPSETDEDYSRWEPVREFAAKIVRFSRSSGFIGAILSILLHLIIFFVLMYFFIALPKKWEGVEILGSNIPPAVETPVITVLPGIPLENNNVKDEETDAVKEKPVEVHTPETATVITAQQKPQTDMGTAAEPLETVPDIDGKQSTGGSKNERAGKFVSGGGYEGRTKTGRGRAVGSGDSSASGENAVESGLAWLAAHQIKNGTHQGSWCFDFAESCGQCSNSGTHGSRIAATAAALLPFLGAGYTFEGTAAENPYKNVVEDGLAYLLKSAKETGTGCDLQQATDRMYSQGIATMALCEAYAMCKRNPKPKRLSFVAQEAIRFIEEAQDPHTGGWRYDPRQSPGDLSVSAWQIMALKSAKNGGLNVSQPVIYGITDFLDLVQDDGGRQYHYLPQNVREPMRGKGEDSKINSNATGLLLRMYTGWKPDEKPLEEGVDAVALHGALKRDANGKIICNPYFVYYATLLLHHYGGSNWNSWNRQIQELLVNSQSTGGHEAGSWYFPDYYCDKGGRLLNTSLALLILETPYRIMPLFRQP